MRCQYFLLSDMSGPECSPVPFRGDKNLSPLMLAMVTTEVAEPEGAWVKPKAARSVDSSVIVPTLDADASHSTSDRIL